MNALARCLNSPATKKLVYNLSGFNKYGLMRDDVLYEDEVVKEALRRLPKRLYDERVYRQMRAVQLSIQRTVLPKKEWTKLEDDVRYLEPYIKRVEAEIKEQKEWETKY